MFRIDLNILNSNLVLLFSQLCLLFIIKKYTKNLIILFIFNVSVFDETETFLLTEVNKN